MRRAACRTISRSRSHSRSRSSLSPPAQSTSAAEARARLSADEVATLEAWERDVRDIETRQLAEAERVAAAPSPPTASTQPTTIDSEQGRQRDANSADDLDSSSPSTTIRVGDLTPAAVPRRGSADDDEMALLK